MVLSDHKGNYNTFIGYNEELAPNLCWFWFFVNAFERNLVVWTKCIALWNNSLVRRTGLRYRYWFWDDGNGICHDQATVGDICYSIQRAIHYKEDKQQLNKVIKRGMNADHSWERVCQEYIEMYQLLINKKNES
jgi:starch synthase